MYLTPSPPPIRIRKEEERLKKNKERRQQREKQKGGPRRQSVGVGADGPMSPEADTGLERGGTTRKCANCGQVGHIKTNKKYVLPSSVPVTRAPVSSLPFPARVSFMSLFGGHQVRPRVRWLLLTLCFSFALPFYAACILRIGADNELTQGCAPYSMAPRAPKLPIPMPQELTASSACTMSNCSFAHTDTDLRLVIFLLGWTKIPWWKWSPHNIYLATAAASPAQSRHGPKHAHMLPTGLSTCTGTQQALHLPNVKARSHLKHEQGETQLALS